MTTKKDFTAEEWHVVLHSPVNVTTYVITSDLSIIGTLKEMRALGRALNEPTVPLAAQELIVSLVADLEAKANAQESLDAPETGEGGNIREACRSSVRQAAAVLDAKALPAEATGFKRWLMEIAQNVARAHKEGSVLGAGGVRVTDKEKAALAEIKTSLGL